MTFKIEWSVATITPYGKTTFESRLKKAYSSAEALNYLQDILDDPSLVALRVSRSLGEAKGTSALGEMQQTSRA
jgi:hypothetical protein